MKPTQQAIDEYNSGTAETKQALINIFGSDAFRQEEKTPSPPDITDRIKTFADVLAEANETQESFNERTRNMSPDTVGYEMLKLITLVFNGGNKLDYSNSDQPKWFPWFRYNQNRAGFVFVVVTYDYSGTASGLGPRLCFFKREHAEYAGKQFEAVYNQMLLG